MTLAVKRLIRDVAARLPELAHVRASRVLVVAGEARGTSRATVRPGNVGPARGGRRRRFVRVRGRSILYVITLRPLWFAASTPEERVATVLHELYHLSARFDGALHRGRRHARLPRAAFDRKVALLLGRYLPRASEEVLAPFAHEGLAKVQMWLRVPPARGPGPLDVDAHLFLGYMPMRARTAPRPASPAPGGDPGAERARARPAARSSLPRGRVTPYGKGRRRPTEEGMA
jgi:predicted metallopeptidase